mgnify:CR=1 FL=1
MERISRDEMLMEMAGTVAHRGTCSRLQVGAVFSKEGRIISMGYNGAPKGMAHCEHHQITWNRTARPYDYSAFPIWLEDLMIKTNFDMSSEIAEGTTFSTDGRILSMSPSAAASAAACSISEHAERNAIAWAARYGLALEGCELHVTHMPCLECARSVINAGITRVVYHQPYRLTAGVELLRSADIDVVAWL